MSAWKKLIRFGLHACGGLPAVRHWNRRGLRILTYHAFSPAALPVLEQQCEHVRRYYQPVSMAAVAASFAGDPLPDNALAVTVDDGYADFAGAQTVFKKYGIPVAVYLVTDFLDRKTWFWWNRILYAFSHTDCREFEIVLSAGPATPARFPLESDAQRQFAANTVIEAAKALPEPERSAVCDEVLERLSVQLPELPDEWQPLSWDQVRQLRRDGVEFGAHTKTHPILPAVDDTGKLRQEIVWSKKRIEEELDEAVIHFAYPNGQFDQRTVDIVRGSGFQTAATTEAGLNFHPDPMLLRRFSADLQAPLFYYAEEISGVRHLRARRIEGIQRPGSWVQRVHRV